MLRWCRVSVSVSLATRGQSDIRGLGTAGRAVRLERFRLSSIERGLGVVGTGLLIGRSRVAPRAVTESVPTKQLVVDDGGYMSSRTASDQHHPASSRAIAVVATWCRFLWSMNFTHRW